MSTFGTSNPEAENFYNILLINICSIIQYCMNNIGMLENQHDTIAAFLV